MKAIEIKSKIFSEIETLDNARLQELYGVVQNFLHSQKEDEDWNMLSEEEQNGTSLAIDEVNAGKIILHEDIVAKYRGKYVNA